MVGGEGKVEGGKDRQPVPRAKLFCLRFCGRIGFVARFTLTLDKHFTFGLGLEVFFFLGGERRQAKCERARKGDHTPSAGRPREEYHIGVTPWAAAAGVQDGMLNDDGYG